VIGEPLALGAIHEITTLLAITTEEGAKGAVGLNEHNS